VFLVPGATGGTETYARELIPRLVEAAPAASFTAFINREAAQAGDGPWGDLIPAVTVPVQASRRVDWVRGEQIILPRLAAQAGVSLVHSLANTAPAWGRFRRVVTIHDLAYRLVPDAHLGRLGYGMRVLVPLAARSSHRIIVDAASTAADLQRYLGTAAGKIDTIPLGIGTERRAEPLPEQEIRRRLAADDRPIVLSVSAKRPHKNLGRLIGALALLDRQPRPLLVLPGYSTPHEAELRARAVSAGVTDDVRFLDWVAPDELEGLYAAAACFVFPSLMEGFGLPVLEAMARGVPVACSARGSLAEVAGDAALFFNAESEPEIAAAIRTLLTDPNTADRLRAAGRQQALLFDWERTAASTLVSYETALKASP
jgi:glycosyltransferase involved in cell wall biosynthesis